MALEPTDLDIDKIEGAMRAGAGYERAATMVTGVSRPTVYRWKRQGLADLEAGRDTPLSRLARKVEVQQATLIAKAENLVHRAVDGPVKCADCEKAIPTRELSEKDRLHNARWLLSKLAREEYGDEISIKVQGAVESMLEAVEPHMTRPAYVELLTALSAVADVDLGTSARESGDEEDPLPLH